VHGGCNEHFVLADTNRDVTVIRSGEAFVIEATTDLADVLLQLVNIRHDLDSSVGSEMYGSRNQVPHGGKLVSV